MSAVPSALAVDLLQDEPLRTGAPQVRGAAPSHIAPTDATVIPLTRPRRRVNDSVPASHPAASSEPVGVPCAARPSTGFRHLDGPCQCFFGGAAPVFPATFDPAVHA